MGLRETIRGGIICIYVIVNILSDEIINGTISEITCTYVKMNKTKYIVVFINSASYSRFQHFIVLNIYRYRLTIKISKKYKIC